jgi:hypothetical protein
MAGPAHAASSGAAALALIALLLAPVALASTAGLPADPLAKEIRDREPAGLPPAGALDPIADVSRSFDKASSSSQDVALDERTSANAIALSRASGVPFRVGDIATRDTARARTETATQRFALAPENVLSALTLGVRPVAGALQGLMDRSVTFSGSDALTRRATIPDENANGGVALLANGFVLDPHALVSYQDVARGGTATRDLPAGRVDPTLTQAIALPRPVAVAAAPLFRANGTVPPLDLANATLRNSDSGSSFRDVRLPEENVFAGIALRNNGGRVDAADLLDVTQRSVASRVDAQAVALDREVALDALLLGARGA